MKVDVNEAINQIAEGLGITVDKLYPVLQKQAMISAAMNILWMLLFSTIIISFALTIRHVIKKQKATKDYEWDWDEPRQVTILFIGIPATIIGLVVIPFCIESIITALFNTEYYMIDKILSKLN